MNVKNGMTSINRRAIDTWTHVMTLLSLSELQDISTLSARLIVAPVLHALLYTVSTKNKATEFLPRDAMQARSMLSCSVCLSVCPPNTFVDHVKTNKHIFEIFSPSGSDTILVFPYQRGCRYSDGNPPNGGVECKGGMKNQAFRPLFSPISRSIS